MSKNIRLLRKRLYKSREKDETLLLVYYYMYVLHIHGVSEMADQL